MSEETNVEQKASNPNGRLNLTSLFWLFMFGSALGFVCEGIWDILRLGYWRNHSSLVWGPFCIVYGLGAVAVYVLAQMFHSKNIIIQVLIYMAAGTLVEYLASVFQEVCFGSVSWDYSKHQFNLNGRVSLFMTFIWGVLGIAFVKLLYPPLKKLFSKNVSNILKAATVVCAVFMAVNVVVSCAAIVRWRQRLLGTEANNIVAEHLDKYYDDERMKSIYSNMTFIMDEDKVA